MSIRYKFILTLLSLTLCCLSLYIWIAKTVFEKDKEVAIFETAGLTSEAQASTLRQQIEISTEDAKTLLNMLSADGQSLSAAGNDLFQKRKELFFVGILEGQKFLFFQSKYSTFKSDSILPRLQFLKSMIFPLGDKGHFGIAVNIRNASGENKDKKLVLGVNLQKQMQMLDFSSETGGSFLSLEGKAISEKEQFPYSFAQNFVSALPSGENIQDQILIEKVAGKEYLISSKAVQFGDLRVLNVVPKEAAFMGLSLLYRKSIQFFALIFFIVLGVSVVMSSTLLRNLSRLTDATSEVSKGHFDFDVGVQSKDEFGTLAGSFQRMSQEIKHLISETKEKARMEGELKTAQTVQENLFPTSGFKNELVELQGLYRPASECGGDWWYHFEHATGLYVFICDATGHGAPAALITAAAKASVNLMKREADLNLRKLTEAFNYALYETARGNLLMTGFIMHIKPDGSMEYVNASHEPTMVFRDGDADYLMTPNGARFGQDPHSVYETGRIDSLRGTFLLLYTDGITSQKDKEGKELGDRRFTRFLNKVDFKTVDLKELNEQVFGLVDDFRKEHPQEDDLTIITVRFADS